ncbi:MAG: hypothetical protein WDO74_33235 [Pseudomonadota bacterium]
MKQLRRATCSLILGLGATVSIDAFAADACETAYYMEQALQKKNMPVEARAQLERCVNVCTADTPAARTALTDCNDALSKLVVPKIVLTAKDSNGAQITAARVADNGKLIANGLDGTAMEINPGAHTFVFTLGDGREQVVRFSVAETNTDTQEVAAVFPALGPSPVTPAAPVAVAHSNARRVSFQSEDSSTTWELASSDGSLVCVLPCAADLAPEQGYQVRSKAGPRTTFLGSSAAGTNAMVSPPSGSKFLAGTTIVVSAIVAGVGGALYFAGDTRKCGYGKTTDSNNATNYQVEIKGTCDSTPTPPGYTAGTGTDEGNSPEGNRKIGIVLGAVGGAGIVTGTIWFLASRSDPKIDWSNGSGSRSRGPNLGLTVAPGALSLHGVW